MAGIGAAAQKHIGDLLEMHEKNMVGDRRHPAPQEARRRCVRAPLRRGDAQAQRGGLRADLTLSARMISNVGAAPLRLPSPREERGEGDFDAAVSSFPPCSTGRRCRQADEGELARRTSAIMTPENEAATRYFDAIAAALKGLEIFMRDDRSPLYRHGIVAKIVAEYIARLEKSFSSLAQPAGLHGELPHFARRKRLSAVPERARAGKRPPPGAAAAGQHSRARRRCATRWPTSSCATRNFRRPCRSRWPSGSISRTSRTARRSGRSCWRRLPRSRSIPRPCGPTTSSTGRRSTAPPTCR